MLSAASAAAQKVLLSLGNVDNTSDAGKPVSTAQQTALNLKANIAGPTLTGTTTVTTLSLSGTATVTSPQSNFVNIDNRYRVHRDGKLDGGFGDQYLFGDFSAGGAWSTDNGSLPIGNANNFHAYWPTGDIRCEFESGGGELQFYLEGGTGKDAWFGFQEAANHKWSCGNDFSQSNSFVICSGFGLTDATTYLGINNTTGLIRVPKGFGVNVLTGLHKPIVAHQTFLIQEGDLGSDGVIQLAAWNAGSVGTAIIMTGQESAGDGRHWVIQHRGTGDTNAFKIGYATTTADGQNIATLATTFFTISKTGTVTLAGVFFLAAYTVATLPSAAANDGGTVRVTDSNVAASGNYGATVAGGGANKVRVFSDGINWIIA